MTKVINLDDVKHSWIAKILEDEETGDAILEFPDDLLEKVGWKEGDVLRWSTDGEGKIMIAKVDK